MTHTLVFYQDQLLQGAKPAPLRSTHRMLLPEKIAGGTEMATWLDSKKTPASDNWTLFVDHRISV